MTDFFFFFFWFSSSFCAPPVFACPQYTFYAQCPFKLLPSTLGNIYNDREKEVMIIITNTYNNYIHREQNFIILHVISYWILWILIIKSLYNYTNLFNRGVRYFNNSYNL